MQLESQLAVQGNPLFRFLQPGYRSKIAERRRAIARNARMKAITGALRLIMSVLAKLAVSSYALPYRGVAST
jgi:hypothetical protein